MNKRIFGNSNFHISEVGLGCWQLGGDCWGDLDEAEALDILQAAVESGVNFLDTADVYGGGRSEQLIGRFLKGNQDELFVATKLGRRDHMFPDNFTPENLRGCTEDSLKHLGVESLDLTQLHCLPTEVLRQGEVFDEMRKLKEAGLIRHWGVSVESMEEALICLEQDGLTSLQIIFNVFRHKPAEILFEKAKAMNIAIIVRLPLASGLLSGKLSPDSTFSENDHRGFNADGQFFNIGETFAGLGLDKGTELADELKPLVPEGMSMATMALRWILDFDGITTIIPGASRVEQAQANASVSKWPPLPDQLHEKLKAFYNERVMSHIRGPY